MGCKFSKGICFRRKRKKTSRENKESGKHLKTRGRREVLAKREGEIETDEKLLERGKVNDKEAVKTLVQVGLDESIANELVLRQEKGFLASTKDVVAILEKNNKKYQLHLGENILVRVNSLGQLSCKNFGDETHEENSKQNGIDSKQKINLNSASKNALETIKGIGPTIADRIIQYRQKHGPFAKIEDIVSVRGVSEKLLEKISLQVTVESSKSNDVENDEKRRTSTNQTVPRVSDGTVRIASWNLLSFSSDKADNTGVREVICRTILENEIDILAVQEIGDENALHKIKDELNNPTMEGLRNWKNYGRWECCTSDVAGYMFRSKEYNGFLWNVSTTKGIRLKSDALLQKPKEGHKQFARKPYLGFFEAKKFDFVLVSVHLKAAGLGNSDIERLQEELSRVPDLVEALQKHIPGEKDMIVVGDFNLGPEEKEFDAMRKGRLENVIPGSTFTNISVKNMQGSKNYDNIWISHHAKLHHFTGQSGVVRGGLTHPHIPDGWRWNGLVSDHCPVWAEFYCERDFDRTTGHVTVEDLMIDGQQGGH